MDIVAVDAQQDALDVQGIVQELVLDVLEPVKQFVQAIAKKHVVVIAEVDVVVNQREFMDVLVAEVEVALDVIRFVLQIVAIIVLAVVSTVVILDVLMIVDKVVIHFVEMIA